MSREEHVALSAKQLKEKCNIDADMTLLDTIAKGLGIAAMGGDASLVAGNQETELQTIKDSFLKGKLGLSDGDDLDGAITKVNEMLGESNPQKQRAAFYYLLAKHFNKTL
ncbi:MAG: DUF2853 family protein [Bacteroidota bacterium]